MGSLTDLQGKRLYLDANVFIYALERLPSFSAAAAAAAILRGFEGGAFAAVTSELTIAECLVKPLQTGSQSSVRVYQQTIRDRLGLEVVPVSRSILVAAAAIRANSTAKLPDAIHVASYRAQKCDVFVTNDQRVCAIAGVQCQLLSELALS